MGIRLRGNHNKIRNRSVRDERFPAIDHVMIAVAYGRGADARQIAAAVRFGHGHGQDDLAVRAARQPFLLLRLF